MEPLLKLWAASSGVRGQHLELECPGLNLSSATSSSVTLGNSPTPLVFELTPLPNGQNALTHWGIISKIKWVCNMLKIVLAYKWFISICWLKVVSQYQTLVDFFYIAFLYRIWYKVITGQRTNLRSLDSYDNLKESFFHKYGMFAKEKQSRSSV